MSLSALSTELDEAIIERLSDDRPALDAMSRVSKYYRMLAEPVLYRDLAFPVVKETQLKRLLMTLLERTELASCIRTVDLLSPNHRPNSDSALAIADRADCKQRLEACSISLRYLLNKTPPFDSNLALQAEHSIFNEESSIDGTLALILSMAVNVENVCVMINRNDPLEITRNALADNSDWPGPARKLAHLCVEWCGEPEATVYPLEVQVPSLVNYLCLRGCFIEKLQQSNSSPVALETLQVVETYIGEETLTDALSSGAFQNLRRLSLLGLQHTPSGVPFIWTMFGGAEVLINALEVYTPILEIFEFYHLNCVYELWPLPFGTFKNLGKLHTLRLDIDWLVFADGAGKSEAIDPRDLLPKSLRRLHIKDLPCERIDMYCKDLDVVDKPASAMQLIVDIARTFPLEQLYVEVAHNEEGPEGAYNFVDATEEAHDFLNKLGTEAKEMGVDLRVWGGHPRELRTWDQDDD